MDFELVLSVFQRVALPIYLPGKFALLSYRNQTAAEAISKCRTNNKSSGLYTDHNINFLIAIMAGYTIDCPFECRAVFKKISNISKNDTGLRKIGDIPTVFTEILFPA
jgi:hypothetical protein